MSAAVAARTSQPRNSPHMSSATSRMGTTSPVDKQKNQSASEARVKQESQTGESDKSTSKRPGSSSDNKSGADASAKNASTTQPLAPPPRPNQQNASDTPDYFSSAHGNNNNKNSSNNSSKRNGGDTNADGSHFSLEPNPFDLSFSNNSAETPGKSLLPPVAALTSPASLLQGGSASNGYPWPNSLRSGPLSPAMLTGPAGSSSDYYESGIRAGFPTPNESSMRTGLTPGGGGSMFPAPSPNTQAIYQQLGSGGATPGTLDFQRTAMSLNRKATGAERGGDANAALAAANAANQNQANNAGVKQEASAENQPQQSPQKQPEKPPQTRATANQAQQQVQQHAGNGVDAFGQHDANDAANGLFMLAQARNDAATGTQFSAANQNQAVNQALQNAAMANQLQQSVQGTSPQSGKRGARNTTSGSISDSARGGSEMSGDFSDGGMEQTKPNTRNKGKKGGAKTQNANGRRKAEEPASKQPAAKKGKSNVGHSFDYDQFDEDDDDDMDEEKHDGKDTRKMTDEEKRKNFLERNRVAALKCRQRKKQWLANLQHRVEVFSTDNENLTAQVTSLREEIVQLKTILLAHKDCSVSQVQGLGGVSMNGMGHEYNPHANPYGMAMANNNQVMAGQGMQRT